MKSKLDRHWDSFNAYLFDIDGTLINCADATHYFAFCQTLRSLSGRELNLEGVTTHGNTDMGILRDALSHAGIDEDLWRPRVAEAIAEMGEFVSARQHEVRAKVLPQVRELLAHLRAKGATIGVATGNLERIGLIKLERAGLWRYFDFGGWSDAHESRSDVFGAAIAKARRLCGEQASVCVLGDTPADISAAHDHGVPVIAVATGVYSYEQLKEQQPEMLVDSFADLMGPMHEP